ncbi:MAG: MBL fold metallo-hydrolase [Candidatus Shapirobacteria bacterium]|nr:MBL fold metallo-hydrolase [Candidatus Shapirobacteria bacterium]
MKWRILLLSVILALGWWGWGFRSRDGVVICDVGQGSGAIIMSGKIEMLVDVGPDNGKMLQCLEKYLPAGDKEIEAVVISHGDSDHVGGLENMKKYYNIEQIYSSAEIRKNDVLRMGKFEIEVVWPEEISGDENADSVVLKIKHDDQLFWFLGDVTSDVEQYISWRKLWGGAGGVLVVSHHGSKSATSQELLDTVRPEEAIISVGKNNRYGHPSPEVIERLKNQGIKIKRTDEKGDIIYIW